MRRCQQFLYYVHVFDTVGSKDLVFESNGLGNPQWKSLKMTISPGCSFATAPVAHCTQKQGRSTEWLHTPFHQLSCPLPPDSHLFVSSQGFQHFGLNTSAGDPLGTLRLLYSAHPSTPCQSHWKMLFQVLLLPRCSDNVLEINQQQELSGPFYAWVGKEKINYKMKRIKE